MALETVTLVLGPAWTLVSGAANGPIEAFSRSSDEVLYYIGDVAPADDYEFGMPRRALSFSSLTAKVWAKSLQGRSLVTMLRTVFAGNATELMLGKVGLSTASFSVSAATGADLFTITNRVAGDAIESFSPNDGRVVLSADRTKFVRGPSAVATGSFDLEIVTTHPLAPNAPKRSKITVTVAPASLRKFATNIGSSPMEQGVRGGGIVVAMGRRPMRLPVRIKRMKVQIPVFTLVTGGAAIAPTTNGIPHADGFATNVRSFQRGINPVWNPDHAAPATGRQLFTFGGQKTATYDPATWDQSKVVIESDWMVLDIPAGQDFEWSNGIRCPAGQVPFTQTMFGDRQPGVAITASTTDTMGTNGLETATGFSPLANTPTGGTIFDNAILIVETEDNVVQVLLLGDSNTYSFGYDYGDPYGVSGMLARGTQNRKNWMAVNLGRGANGDYSDKVPGNTALRRKLIEGIHAVAPFKVRFHAHGGNDITKNYSGVAAWVAATEYKRGDVALSTGNGVYICTKGGISKASGSLTGAGRNIVDGTAEWAQNTLGNGGMDQVVGQMVASKMLAMDAWRASLPGVPVYDVAIVPQTTSTDNWATVAGQTPIGNWGNSTTRRGRMNALIRGLHDLWQAAGFVDPNPLVESGYVAGNTATETSIWMADGVTPKNFTIDGTHWAEFGAIEAAKTLDAINIQAG